MENGWYGGQGTKTIMKDGAAVNWDSRKVSRGKLVG